MNILIIAPAFSAVDSVGSMRMNSLYRYLADSGNKVEVITNLNGKYMVKDDNINFVDTYQGMPGANKLKIFKKNHDLYEAKAKKVLNRFKPDYVIISGGPFYTFTLSSVFSKLDIPCILDFRDPWIFDVRGYKDFISPKRVITRLVQLPYERMAIHSASAVITVTEIWKRQFQRFYPLQRQKFHVIENGYDDILLDTISIQDELSDKFIIGVFGKLFYYTPKYSHVFLSALEKLQDTVSVLHIGEKESESDGYLADHHINQNVFTHTGFLPYLDGMRRLSEAKAFVIVDIRKGAMGTKIYDYIWMNKPIIYIGPQNTEIADFISSFEFGYICQDVESVIHAIKDITNQDTLVLSTRLDKRKYARSFQNRRWMQLLISCSVD